MAGDETLALDLDRPKWAAAGEDRAALRPAIGFFAAFALYVEAATAGVPVVAAGRLPPVDLPLREDLRTRLGSGPVFALQPLSDDDTAAVLRREAARRGIALADEVLAYLLTRYARDLGSLMGLLDALDAFSLAEKRAVTVPLLKKMLAEQAAHDLPLA